MSIKHAELRPEVLTLVNSNLAKYDPNNNGVVDNGDELSQLLSEYQCNPEDLSAKNDGKKMWSLSERIGVNQSIKDRTKGINIGTGLGVLGTTFAGFEIGKHYYKKGVTTETEYVTKQILQDVEELMNDGKYRSNARWAYNAMGYNGVGQFKEYVPHSSLNTYGHFHSPTGKDYYNDCGRYYILRDGKPGDPQFVKTGTKTVNVTEKITNVIKNKSIINKGLKIGGAVGLGGLLVAGAIFTISRIVAKKNAQNEIKAQQAEAGSKEMETRRQQAEEMRQREAALKQEELEYQERMNKATNGIQSNINKANDKAKNLNKELDKALETVTETDVN